MNYASPPPHSCGPSCAACGRRAVSARSRPAPSSASARNASPASKPLPAPRPGGQARRFAWRPAFHPGFSSRSGERPQADFRPTGGLVNGLRVGTWTQPCTGAPSFHYDPAWVASDAARVLSLSLPFTPGNTPHRGAVVSNFFENLLPDSDVIRRRLQARFSTDSTAAFDLLTAIGRDCVGALKLLPPD